MAGPFVSILITSFNYARFLGEAIDSALAQSYQPLEVIVVDDGSTDGSAEVIARFGDRIIPILKANGGQASAINAGFAAARGDVVLTLDADDRLLPGAVARVAAAWRPDVAKVQWRLRVIDAAGRPQPICVPDVRRHMPSGDVAPIVLDRFLYPSPPTSGNAYTRRIAAEVLPVPPVEWSLTSDAYLATTLAFRGPVVSIQEVLGEYRVHGANGWACAPLDTRTLARLVAHARQREALVARLAAEAGLAAPADLALRDAWCAGVRLALRVVAPDRDPAAPGESLAALTLQGVRAALDHPGAGLPERLALAAWFVAVAGLPRRAASRVALAALAAKRARLAPATVRPEALPAPLPSPIGALAVPAQPAR
jgi:hypothetical protein